jgi:LemA protein
MPKEKPFYLKPWLWVLVIVAVIAVWFIGTYNNLVVLNQAVDNQWAQVQTQYQRRIDLIPNLVNTAKGYMQFEKSLLEQITSLRSQWMAAATVDDKVRFGNSLDTALGRLLAVYENYPNLKSDTVVASLMDELAGTENRIAVERMRFNDRVRDYDTTIKLFPTNAIAGMFGFNERPYFQAQPGSEIVPTVNISIS